MKKKSKGKNKMDVFELLVDFRKIINNQPPVMKMVNDLKMMGFKIRPMGGDISIFNVENEKLIGAVWSLGKLDELFGKEIKKMTPIERGAFFHAFKELKDQIQNKIQLIKLDEKKMDGVSSLLKMEIFKIKEAKKKSN